MCPQAERSSNEIEEKRRQLAWHLLHRGPSDADDGCCRRGRKTGAQPRTNRLCPSLFAHLVGNVNSRLEASKLLLSSMLSRRNVDPDHSIVVNTVRYHDTDGKLLKED